MLLLYGPVNNFSVMLGRIPVFLALTNTKPRIKCLAQGLNAVSPVSFEPANLSPQVKYHTTEPPRSSTWPREVGGNNENISSQLNLFLWIKKEAVLFVIWQPLRKFLARRMCCTQNRGYLTQQCTQNISFFHNTLYII